MILCGGRGTRISEETYKIPKPLVQVGAIPILTHIVAKFLLHDITDFIFLLGYRGQQIIDYWKSASSNDLYTLMQISGQPMNRTPNVEFLDTGLETQTGGRLGRARHLLNSDSAFFVTYGDGLSNVDLSDQWNFHQSHRGSGTVLAVRPPARFGALEVLEDLRVGSFREKVQGSEGWINGGFMILEHSTLELIQDDQTVLEGKPIEDLVKRKELFAFLHSGFWQCMDTVRDKEMLNELWEKGETPWLKLQ